MPVVSDEEVEMEPGQLTQRWRSEGSSREVWIVLVATTLLREVTVGSPVLVLTSKRGKLLEEMSSRMRWPAVKRFAVSGAMTSIS